MFKKSLLLTALYALVAISQASASVVVYTDLASFTAAAGNIATETFTGGAFNTGLTAVTDAGSVSPQEYWTDRIVEGGESTTFSFAGAESFAFGGDFDLGPGGPGQGIAITLNLTGGGVFLVPSEVPNSSTGQFFGLVSTEGFSSVLLNGGTQGGSAETFNLDNVAFSTPEPASLALMGAGLAGLGLLARRKKVV